MLTVKTTHAPYGHVITISDALRDYQTCADPDISPRVHLEALAREYRQKADQCTRMAAFLAEAVETMDN